MLSPHFALLAALINLSSIYPYLQAMRKSEVTPNLVSWILWATISFITAAAQFSGGVGLSTVLVLASGINSALIVIYALVKRRCSWHFGLFDYGCGALSIMGVLGWSLSGNQDVAIMFGIVADGFAALPTLRKAWLRPETENAASYLLCSVAAMVSLLSLPRPVFTAYGFPLYMFLMDLAIVLAIMRERIRCFVQAGGCS